MDFILRIFLFFFVFFSKFGMLATKLILYKFGKFFQIQTNHIYHKTAIEKKMVYIVIDYLSQDTLVRDYNLDEFLFKLAFVGRALIEVFQIKESF